MNTQTWSQQPLAIWRRILVTHSGSYLQRLQVITACESLRPPGLWETTGVTVPSPRLREQGAPYCHQTQHGQEFGRGRKWLWEDTLSPTGQSPSRLTADSNDVGNFKVYINLSDLVYDTGVGICKNLPRQSHVLMCSQDAGVGSLSSGVQEKCFHPFFFFFLIGR